MVAFALWRHQREQESARADTAPESEVLSQREHPDSQIE
jgi:hypothetical protein